MKLHTRSSTCDDDCEQEAVTVGHESYPTGRSTSSRHQTYTRTEYGRSLYARDTARSRSNDVRAWAKRRNKKRRAGGPSWRRRRRGRRAYEGRAWPNESGRNGPERLFEPRNDGSVPRRRASDARRRSPPAVAFPEATDADRTGLANGAVIGTGTRTSTPGNRNDRPPLFRSDTRRLHCRPPPDPFGARRCEPRPFGIGGRTPVVAARFSSRPGLRTSPVRDSLTCEASDGSSDRPRSVLTVMILPQVHLRKPCYDFYFL